MFPIARLPNSQLRYGLCQCRRQRPTRCGSFCAYPLEKYVSSIDIESEFEETLWLSLKLRAGDCLIFGVIYHSPSSTESNNSALNTILATLCVQESPKYSHICVVGVTISCYYIFTCLLNMMNPT